MLWKDLLKYGYLLVVNVNNSYFIANTDAYVSSLQTLRAAQGGRGHRALESGHDEEGGDRVARHARRRRLYLTNAKPAEIARAVDAVKPYWDDGRNARPDAVEALTKVRAALNR